MRWFRANDGAYLSSVRVTRFFVDFDVRSRKILFCHGFQKNTKETFIFRGRDRHCQRDYLSALYDMFLGIPSLRLSGRLGLEPVRSKF